jgi:hypothetical protein
MPKAPENSVHPKSRPNGAPGWSATRADRGGLAGQLGILTARKPETRTRRIEETARLAAENVRANQWRK